MSEPAGEYITKQEVEEGLALLHGEPSLVIEPERTVIERRAGELKETIIPAFVKISTSFKSELATISDAALKVWIFIALSVNRNTGTAHPGLRTIAAVLGKGVNTIQECLKELEDAKLLQVDRQSRKYNIYEPTAYVSANRADPVSGSDTDGKTVSEKAGSVSENHQTVSDSQIHNQRNQKKPEGDKSPLAENLEQVKQEANHRVDVILEQERKNEDSRRAGTAWRGRELLPPHLLVYGDWWHKQTGLHMYGEKGKARQNTEWLKAFREWWENDVTTATLAEVYQSEKAWKGLIGKPSELTTKARALQALSIMSTESTPAVSYDATGVPETY